MKRITVMILLCLSFSCEKKTEIENVNKEVKTNIVENNTSVKESEKVKSESESVKGEVSLNAESVKNYGIKSQTLKKKIFIESINTTGLIKETENSVYKINSPVQGKVIFDGVKIGDYVSKGQKIASIQNSDVTKIYSNYIHESHNNEVLIRQAKIKLGLAEKTLEREKKLFEQGISARKDYDNASTEYELVKADLEGLKEHEIHIKEEAQALLANYGVKLENSRSEAIISVSPITAPNNGIITKKNITEGAVISSGEEIYEITDLSSVYVNINIQDKDIKNIRLGQSIIFTSDAIGKSYNGNIDNISPSVNPETQTFTVRAKIDNSGGFLRSGTFGKVKISLNSDSVAPMLFIPNQALQTYNGEKFVFVEVKPNTFKKVVINADKSDKDGLYIKKGLKESDLVVNNGAFILKSEFLKDEFKEEE